MKLFKRILAALVALFLLSSCSILGLGSTGTTGTTASTSTGTSMGSTTGSALASILGVLLSSGSIDLGNIGNIINIASILTGANSLVNATADYTQQFTQGLIQGSNNLVNKANSSEVISQLKSLASVDSSAFTKAANTKGYASTSKPLSTSDKNVAATMDALNGLLGTLNKK